MMNIVINERRQGDVLILDLEGSITLGVSCAKLRSIINSLVAQGEKKILLNVSHIEYIDSSGLGELVGGYTNLQENNGELKLLHLSPKVYELLVLTKLITIFDIYDSEPTAIQGFKTPALKSVYVAA